MDIYSIVLCKNTFLYRTPPYSSLSHVVQLFAYPYQAILQSKLRLVVFRYSYRTAISTNDSCIKIPGSNDGAFLAVANSFASHFVSVARFRRKTCFPEYLRDDFFCARVYPLLCIQSDPLLLVNSTRWIYGVANTPIIATPITCKRVSRF